MSRLAKGSAVRHGVQDGSGGEGPGFAPSTDGPVDLLVGTPQNAWVLK
jgi:hypothetical protein